MAGITLAGDAVGVSGWVWRLVIWPWASTGSSMRNGCSPDRHHEHHQVRPRARDGHQAELPHPGKHGVDRSRRQAGENRGSEMGPDRGSGNRRPPECLEEPPRLGTCRGARKRRSRTRSRRRAAAAPGQQNYDTHSHHNRPGGATGPFLTEAGPWPSRVRGQGLRRPQLLRPERPAWGASSCPRLLMGSHRAGLRSGGAVQDLHRNRICPEATTSHRAVRLPNRRGPPLNSSLPARRPASEPYGLSPRDLSTQ